MITTLEKIRAHGPCSDGWAKLLKHLGKTQADDEPLPILTILNSNGLDDALWCLRAVEGHNREIRLFAVWCARQVQHLMKDQRSVDALDVAERYANGLASAQELNDARKAAGEAAWAASWEAWSARAARAAARQVRPAAWEAAGEAAGEAREAARAAGEAARAAAVAAAREAAREAAWAAGEAARQAAWVAGAAARAAAREDQEKELRRILANM